MRAMHRIKKTSLFLGYISNVIGTTVLLIIIGHFLLGIADFAINTNYKRANTPVYDDYPNNAEFWREQLKTWNIHFEPYYHWRRDGFQGKYTNVSNDGIRRTVASTIHHDAKKIFMFGGSTLWGTGCKDEHTIPSFLQSMLGKQYKIYNYGDTGYVSTQELNYLLEQLAKGNIPDTVIFYDGVNDGYAGVYSPAIPRDVQNIRMSCNKPTKTSAFISLFKASNYIKLMDYVANKETTIKKWDDKILSKIKSNSSSVVKLYDAHIKQVKALGKEYGFKTFFFWQPNLISRAKENRLPYEQAIIQKASPVFVESQYQVYLDAKSTFINRENEQIFFMGDIFNQNHKPIYFDWSHIGPYGNEIVASWMFDKINDYLK